MVIGATVQDKGIPCLLVTNRSVITLNAYIVIITNNAGFYLRGGGQEKIPPPPIFFSTSPQNIDLICLLLFVTGSRKGTTPHKKNSSFYLYTSENCLPIDTLPFKSIRLRKYGVMKG